MLQYICIGKILRLLQGDHDMEKKKMWIFAVLVVLGALLFAGCSGKKPAEPPVDGDGMERTYTQIDQDTAVFMMENEKDYVILDVRRYDEYEEGHIPGAICIPNERIGGTKLAELPDFDQTILVYCRSGNRSKQAAEKLVKIGYNKIFEFGGILDWKGETVQGMEPYGGYDMTPTYTWVVKIGDYTFPIEPASNAASDELLEKLKSEGPLVVDMHDYGDFEKVGDLPWPLTRDDKEITTKLGDITIYQGNQISIYYDENTWSLTKVGEVYYWDEPERLLDALGDGDVTVEFYLEWSE